MNDWDRKREGDRKRVGERERRRAGEGETYLTDKIFERHPENTVISGFKATENGHMWVFNPEEREKRGDEALAVKGRERRKR